MQHVHQLAEPSSPTGSFLSRLLDADFIPRSQCIGDNNPGLIWLHVASDAVIAAAYYSIPIALVYFVRRRRDLAFNWMFLLFAAFILACGTTHVFGVLAVWHPMYRLDGVIKAITGVLSIGTALALWALIPRALALPSPDALRLTNAKLEGEVREREAAEQRLREVHAELERRVKERTADLAAANASLQAEVAERRRIEERQAMVMAELDHRVKNNLSTVISLAEQTQRSSETMGDFAEAFMGRIGSLARLHESLARSRWGGADLRELVEQTLDPYRSGEDGGERVWIEGGSLIVPARVGTSVCMTLHELATNAAKYGALSTASGRVTVRWSVEPGGAGPGQDVRVRLLWEEAGGPPVEPPAKRGFGTELIQNGIRYELRGQARLEFRPAGVVCELSWPMKQAAAGRAAAPVAGQSAGVAAEKHGAP